MCLLLKCLKNIFGNLLKWDNSSSFLDIATLCFRKKLCQNNFGIRTLLVLYLIFCVHTHLFWAINKAQGFENQVGNYNIYDVYRRFFSESWTRAHSAAIKLKSKKRYNIISANSNYTEDDILDFTFKLKNCHKKIIKIQIVLINFCYKQKNLKKVPLWVNPIQECQQFCALSSLDKMYLRQLKFFCRIHAKFMFYYIWWYWLAWALFAMTWDAAIINFNVDVICIFIMWGSMMETNCNSRN